MLNIITKTRTHLTCGVLGLMLAMTGLSSQVAAATGTLASDSPCVLAPGANKCTVTLTANKQGTPMSCIWRTAPVLGLVACSGANQWNQPWPHTNITGQTMQLRAHQTQPSGNQNDFNQGQFLDEIVVNAIPQASGQLSSNSPCQLTPGGAQCAVNITIQTNHATVSCLWRTAPSLNLVSCNSDAQWDYNWPWANETGQDMTLKAHATWPTNNPSDFNQGQYLDDLHVHAIPLPTTAAAGGSVVAWYQHTTGGTLPPDSFDRIMPFGIIKNYHNPMLRHRVNMRLQEMYQAGQRRIGVEFFFGRGNKWLNHGTYVSSRAKLDANNQMYFIDPLYLDNLAEFLSDIEHFGYEQVLLNILPGGANNFKSWNSWHGQYVVDIDHSFNGEALKNYQFDSGSSVPRWRQVPIHMENWAVTQAVVDVFEDSGIDYIVDLQNEAVPLQNLYAHADCDDPENNLACSCENSGLVDVKTGVELWRNCLANFPDDLTWYQGRVENLLKTKWQMFRKHYPQVKTTGYSIIANSPWQLNNRIPSMAKVYGNDLPEYVNLHIYNQDFTQVTDIFNTAKNLVGGHRIIIGETYYNNPVTAMTFRDAQIATGAQIEFLIQWPKHPTAGYDHPMPYHFNEYLQEGF